MRKMINYCCIILLRSSDDSTIFCSYTRNIKYKAKINILFYPIYSIVASIPLKLFYLTNIV